MKRTEFEERHRQRYAAVVRREMTLEDAMRENDVDWQSLEHSDKFCPACRRVYKDGGHDEECSIAKLSAELDSRIAEIVRLEQEWDALNDMRIMERERVFALHGALEEVRDRDWTENVLDPQWAAGVAKRVLRRDSEAVECDYCGAPAGHPCNAEEEGVARPEPHKDRWQAFARAPLPEHAGVPDGT